ncbi:MAG: type 1 glutamine amidotransferase domain-containing protein [Rubrivivax sp.]|jgi:putative intracellular protease/amidase|nr:type 1 glutamine amidotransferase domain-containing protein [Rubrivivax sp.]
MGTRRRFVATVCGAALVAFAATVRAQQRQRVLIVLTNTAVVPGSSRRTGVWASEYTEPFEVFSRAGYEVHVASPAGGPSPVDPRSGSEDQVRRLPEAWQAMQQTRRLADLRAEDYAAVFLAGGHGTMWDFPDSAELASLVAAMFERDRPLGAVCHGPAGLLGARKADGTPWIAGRRVNGFTNAEEAAAGMTRVVPFLLEDRLRAAGGRFESGGVFARHVVVDGNLVTGQNPASSIAVAEAMVEQLQRRDSR